MWVGRPFSSLVLMRALAWWSSFFVGMVGVAKWVYGVVVECVYAGGTVREDLDLWRVFVEVEGNCDGS
jgi:hypothetical protein